VLDLVANASFRAGIPIGFSFPFYGYTYDSAWMSTSGVLGLGQPIGWSVGSYVNERLPSAKLGPAIAAFWDELSPTGDRRLAYRTYGTAPNRVFVAEWSSDHYCCKWRGDQANYPAFRVELHEDGTILIQYRDLTGDSVDRAQASIGIQNETSSIGLQYAYHEAAVQDGLQIEFLRPTGLATMPYVPPVPATEVALRDCQQSLVGGFRKLAQTDYHVNSRIGCPRAPETSFQFSQQEFEGGHMLYRPDTKQIIVRFADDGRWASFADPYQGEPEPDSTPPEGRVAPKLGFGKLWRTNQGLHDRLGWALAGERYFQGALEEFTGGTLIWTGVEQWLMRAYFQDGSSVVTLDPTQLS
jgi:hypothetical protein